MVICCKKLLKLLIDIDLNKAELHEMTGVSSATITKLAKNETVNTGVLIKTCNALQRDTSDIMEMADADKAKLTVIRRREGYSEIHTMMIAGVSKGMKMGVLRCPIFPL